MSDLKNKLQHLISGQVPDYLRASYPKYVEFLKEYYRFLDTNRQANDLLLNAKRWSDVDLTLNMFVEELFKQYAYNISPEVLVEQRRLIKFIHQFYEAKGSENAAELYFRMMYNDDIKVKYPGDYVLRASDGKWSVKKTIKVDTDYNIIYGPKLDLATLPFAQIEIDNEGDVVPKENPDSTFDLKEKIIYLRYQITDYDTFQYVDRSFRVNCLYVRRSVNNPDIFELDIEFSDIRSAQQINEELSSDSRLGVVWVVAKAASGAEQIYGFLTQQLLSYYIEESGKNYRLRDTFVIDELEETALPIELASVQRINNGIVRVNKLGSTEVENYFSQEYVKRENEYTQSGLRGLIKSLRFISTGYRFDSSTGYFAEDYIDLIPDGDYTRIVDNRARYFAQDYCGDVYTRFNEFTMDFTNPRNSEDTPAKVTFKLGHIFEHPGIWKDSSGFLSDVNKLQDNRYYQPFSYVIQTVNTPYQTWNGLYRNTAHPAGFEVFGEMIVEHDVTFPSITIESGIKIDYMITDTVFAFDGVTKQIDIAVNDDVYATPYAIDYFEIPLTYTAGDSISISYNKFDSENIVITDNNNQAPSYLFVENVIITDVIIKELIKNISDVVLVSANYAIDYFGEVYTSSDQVTIESTGITVYYVDPGYVLDNYVSA